MSLEAALTRNNELLEQNNALMAKLLASANAGSVVASGSAASNDDGAGEETKAEEKPKATRAKKADKAAETTSAGDGFEIGYADLKKALGAWLAEFAKAEDKAAPDGAHPEVKARKAALKACFTKLGVEKLDEMEKDAKKLTALNKWFVTKAKVDDHVGVGAGRFAADPEDAEEAGDEDDIGDL